MGRAARALAPASCIRYKPSLMETLLIVLHVIVCVFLMLTVLLQSGKSGGMGAAFGGGGNTASVFGGAGSNPFLQKVTTWAAAIFMLTSITLAYVASKSNSRLKDIGATEAAKAAAADEALKKALESIPAAAPVEPTLDGAAMPADPAAVPAVDGAIVPAVDPEAAPAAPSAASATPAAAPAPTAAPAPAAPTPAPVAPAEPTAPAAP